jgi:hypothetical protein
MRFEVLTKVNDEHTASIFSREDENGKFFRNFGIYLQAYTA